MKWNKIRVDYAATELLPGTPLGIEYAVFYVGVAYKIEAHLMRYSAVDGSFKLAVAAIRRGYSEFDQTVFDGWAVELRALLAAEVRQLMSDLGTARSYLQEGAKDA